MCGICGWVTERRDDVGLELLEGMAAQVAHRGPDDADTWHHEGAFLGHRRLAVIDPSTAGRQPMHFGQTTVVYNGEIYNFAALRRELQTRSRTFKTQTDTEVLLQGYDEWGIDELLQRIDGMYAFALWDRRERRLVLARDRMGEKPLYYSHLPDGTLVFASELRAILRHPGISRDLDPVALRKYLTYDYVPAPRTMMLNVKKLQAGEFLEWTAGRVTRIVRHWDAPRPTGELKDAESASKSLWDNIRSAVQSRLVSDVPVGLFLSGGLDSTAIVAAACELREPASLPTFCIGFDDPTFDETPHARAVAEHLGTPLYEQRLSAKSMLNLLPQILAQLDEPLADPSLVPTSLLARFTRQHVKVALGGDGGDELFLGYPTFGAHRPAQVLSQIPRLVRRGLIQPAVQALPVSDNNWSLDYRLKRFVDGLDYDDIARHFIWIGGAAPDTHADLLEPAVYAATAGANPLDDIDRFRQERGVRSNDLDFVAYCYARLYLSDGVLQKVDRATMAHGLESRAPLLARNVLETAARIPTSLKLRGNSTKWILRQALRDRVPASILNRPKKGFGMPVGKWLKGPLLPLCQELLEPSALRKQALFKAESCQKLLNDHQSGWRDNRKVLWALIVFQLWLRHLE